MAKKGPCQVRSCLRCATWDILDREQGLWLRVCANHYNHIGRQNLASFGYNLEEIKAIEKELKI